MSGDDFFYKQNFLSPGLASRSSARGSEREREREREREGERERESNILGCICMYIYTHARAHTHTHTHTYTVDWQSPETEHRRAEEFVAEEFVEGSNAATARRKSHLYVCIYVYRYV
jgi:hypothetical protein